MIAKKILASSLAIFLLASIFFMPKSAESQSPWSLSKISGFSNDIIEIYYDPIESILWVLTANYSGSPKLAYLTSVDPIDQTIISTSQIFNSTDFVVTGGNSLIYDMACNYPFCYFSVGGDASTANDGYIFRADITTTTASVNLSFDKSAVNVVDYAPILATTSGSIGGTTVASGQVLGTSNTGSGQFKTYDGLFVDLDQLIPLTKDVSSGSSIQRNIFDMDWSRLNAPNFYVSGLWASGSTTTLYFVYDMDTDSLVTPIAGCSQVGANDDDSSAVYIDDIDLGYFYIGASNGEIQAYDITDTSCAVSPEYTITPTQTGLSGTAFSMSIVEVSTQKYLVARQIGSGGNISWMPWNGTHFTDYAFIINSAPSSSQGILGTGYVVSKNTAIGRNIANGFDVGKMFIPMTNTDRQIFVIDIGSAFNSGGGGGGGFGPPAVFPQNNIPQVTGLFLCLGGFINATGCDSSTGLPNNGNPKTNGTGIAVLIFLIIISYAFLVWIHIQAMHGAKRQNVHITEVMNIHPVLLVLMLIADFSFVWYLGWLDDIIFYTMIVAVAGLGALGFYARLKGFGQ